MTNNEFFILDCFAHSKGYSNWDDLKKHAKSMFTFDDLEYLGLLCDDKLFSVHSKVKELRNATIKVNEILSDKEFASFFKLDFPDTVQAVREDIERIVKTIEDNKEQKIVCLTFTDRYIPSYVKANLVRRQKDNGWMSSKRFVIRSLENKLFVVEKERGKE